MSNERCKCGYNYQHALKHEHEQDYCPLTHKEFAIEFKKDLAHLRKFKWGQQIRTDDGPALFIRAQRSDFRGRPFAYADVLMKGGGVVIGLSDQESRRLKAMKRP